MTLVTSSRHNGSGIPNQSNLLPIEHHLQSADATRKVRCPIAVPSFRRFRYRGYVYIELSS